MKPKRELLFCQSLNALTASCITTCCVISSITVLLYSTGFKLFSPYGLRITCLSLTRHCCRRPAESFFDLSLPPVAKNNGSLTVASSLSAYFTEGVNPDVVRTTRPLRN